MLHNDSSAGLDCDICYQRYDLTTHLPRVLPHCGHTLCSNCIENIKSSSYPRRFACPFDKKEAPFDADSLAQFPPNFQLKTLIEARASQVFCQEHNKPLDYVCLTHDVKICGDCLLLGNHKDPKGHNVRALTEVESFFLEKRGYLENIKKDIWSYSPDTASLIQIIETQKDFSEFAIRTCFKEIRTHIEKEENKQVEALKKFFEEQVTEIERNNEEYQELKRNIERKVNQYYRLSTIEKPIEILGEDIWQFWAQFRAYKEIFLVKRHEDFFQKFYEMLQDSLETQFLVLSSSKFSHDQIYKELSATKKSSSEQAKSILLQDFEPISQPLGLGSLIPKSGLQAIKDIDFLKNIKEVTFSSSYQKLFVPEEMSRLKRVRTSFSNVEKIHLSLNHSPDVNINEQNLHDLIQILFWKPLNITSINLNLPSRAVTAKTLRFFTEKIFQKTLNLQHLRIIFHKNEFTLQDIEVFLKSLASISKNLISLELDFSRLWYFGREKFPGIALSMPKLKNLSLNLANTCLGDSGLCVFVDQTLNSLTEIETFRLNLRKTCVTENEVKGLLSGILKVLFKCQELKVELPEKCLHYDTLQAFKELCPLSFKENTKVSVESEEWLK